MARRHITWLRFISIGPQFLISTAVGLAIGKYLLDPWLGTDPLFTIVGLFLGLGAAFTQLMRELNHLNRREKDRVDHDQS